MGPSAAIVSISRIHIQSGIAFCRGRPNLLIRDGETWVNDVRNPAVKKIRDRSESDEVRKIDRKRRDDTIGSTVYKKKNKVTYLWIPYSFRLQIVVFTD